VPHMFLRAEKKSSQKCVSEANRLATVGLRRGHKLFSSIVVIGPMIQGRVSAGCGSLTKTSRHPANAGQE
jgi:hypothetical protein